VKATPFSYSVREQDALAAEQQQYRFFGMEWFFEDKNRYGKIEMISVMRTDNHSIC
jgi:hypothetical protein